jgi:DNA (cytosine-5)-methyltransferase 1
MNEPTHLDLFSGIGGFSIAAERSGFRTIGFSEIDPYASAVLRKHWPTVPNFGDIRNVTEDMQVDLITGGFPCQPFSVAGKRGGDSDERFLWPELVRILGNLRPSFALFENVPGLLSIDGGRTFNRILSDIQSIGYDLLWNCVPACAIGANHIRDRLWIVAYATSSKNKRFSLPELHKRNTRLEFTSSNQRFDKSTIIENVADTSNARTKGMCERRNKTVANWWITEPNVGRVAHGIPNRVDRLRCLGNGIVPQVAEVFLKEIRKLM